MRRALALGLAAAALAGTGCGGSDNEREAKAPKPKATPVPTISADTSAKPVIPPPAGSPPAKLVVKDIVQGKGRAAKPGDTVSVDYVGVNYADAKQFDASWDRGQPIQFQLGSGQVIPGWDKGVKGMKPGGRRELVIPPGLAYGPAGQPPVIGPNETLVFVVDLKDVA
jgi:peptidylprolyl isomerase